MKTLRIGGLVVAACLVAIGSSAMAELKSAGPLAFAPKGVLLAGDPIQGAVLAITTGDTKGEPAKVSLDVADLGAKVAAALGTDAKNILIGDMAVNPASGAVYLSVARGRGPDATAVILRLGPDGKFTEVETSKAVKATLPNAPSAASRRSRSQAITDLSYVNGRVIVAGLSSEEFASNLRSIPYPFKEIDKGTSVEIYHGAHGKFETRSPVRTFAAYMIDNKPHLLAAYTCTPLVKFPVGDLTPGTKVRGTTVAELGNRNRPLDMFVYKKNGKDYILMANSSRGVMKISTEDLGRKEGIEERIRGTAGQTYVTIDELKGVVQLDRLNDDHAVVLVRGDGGKLDLQTVALP